MSTNRKRLMRLLAFYGLVDLAKGKNPVKTAAKLVAACGRTGARAVKEKGQKTPVGTRVESAAAGISKWKDPKEIKRRGRRRKLIHLLLHKLA